MLGTTTRAVAPTAQGAQSTDYRLDFYNNAGELDAVVTDYNNFSYTKLVNYPGLMQFEIRGDHPILKRIQDKWEVHVYRRPVGLEWQLDFIGMFRDASWQYEEKQVFVGTCTGTMSKLNWRYNLYYSNVDDFTKFLAVPAETILKRLVEYNCAASATVANGRMREGAIPNVTVEADLGRGNTLDNYCAWKNVLEICVGISGIAGGDYDLVKTSGGQYEFRFYPGQLGTDRRGEVLFSLERGNMGKPNYQHKRSDEKTVASVSGQGEMEFREIEIVLGANYSADNDIEFFVDARDIEIEHPQALIDRGHEKLALAQARETFVFDVLQTPSSRYGVDYFMGDLVNSLNPFNQQEYDQKVDAVTIGFAKDGKETIRIGMRTI